MDRFLIEGGKKLSGTVHISGSKNAANVFFMAPVYAQPGEKMIFLAMLGKLAYNGKGISP